MLRVGHEGAWVAVYGKIERDNWDFPVRTSRRNRGNDRLRGRRPTLAGALLAVDAIAHDQISVDGAAGVYAVVLWDADKLLTRLALGEDSRVRFMDIDFTDGCVREPRRQGIANELAAFGNTLGDALIFNVSDTGDAESLAVGSIDDGDDTGIAAEPACDLRRDVGVVLEFVASHTAVGQHIRLNMDHDFVPVRRKRRRIVRLRHLLDIHASTWVGMHRARESPRERPTWDVGEISRALSSPCSVAVVRASALGCCVGGPWASVQCRRPAWDDRRSPWELSIQFRRAGQMSRRARTSHWPEACQRRSNRINFLRLAKRKIYRN